ncbi:hypothetical protein [Palleronia caenipelagi]|uniref:hypothetical protein n=1 Tax=Palleronia caenipelagi TaxID=2489174 RepID=UPI00163D5ACF|nr:hypothetical protein [Palleronia caenipelagi]
MTRVLALFLLLTACGAGGPPEPVTDGIEVNDRGVKIDVSGTATIGVSGTKF